jgi:hypothetical protein
MEYNTIRDSLSIREYGRNIQKMIGHCISIEDREKRSLTALAIVKVMGQMTNIQTSVASDFEHKLWDHLHIISGFNLDIDAPYPPPNKEEVAKRPAKIEYSSNNIKFPHYGKHIEKVIDAVNEMEEGANKEVVVLAIANYLKKSYLNWNRDSVNDDTIIAHLEKLSEGNLKVNENATLISTSEALAKPSKQKNIVNKKATSFKGSKKRKRK